jgi:mRNA interferase MazF
MEKIYIKGDVVVLSFPYTDFSEVKKRHAVVIANLKGQNIIPA